MISIKFLGTGNAISSLQQANTCLAVQHADETVLVDGPEAPMRRLVEAEIDPLSINHLIVTHFHPDHAASVPVFLMGVWLMGRKAPLTIHGLDDCISRLRKMMDLFRWKTWPDCFPVEINILKGTSLEPVLNLGDLEILASPVRHMIPTIGLLFRNKESGREVGYSCDTEPADEVVELAKNAQVLIHEANGRTPGHSSAAQAGEIAAASQVEKLLLVHYPSSAVEADLKADASSRFKGTVRVTRDFDTIEV